MRTIIALALMLCSTRTAAVELRAVFTWDSDLYCDVYVTEDRGQHWAYSFFDTGSSSTDIPVVQNDFAWLGKTSTISNPVRGYGAVTFTLSPLSGESLAFEARVHTAGRSATEVYVPTTVTVQIYLDGVLVKQPSRFFATDPGYRQEVGSYPTRPKFIFERSNRD